MIKLYVAGAISKGDLDNNLRRASEIGVAFAKLGYAIYVPQMTCFLEAETEQASPSQAQLWYLPKTVGEIDYATWMKISLAWVEVSDVLIRITGDSEGADQEVLHAEHCGIPWFCVNSVEDVADVHMQIQNMEELAI